MTLRSILTGRVFKFLKGTTRMVSMSMVAVKQASPQEDLESYRPLLFSVIAKRVDRADVEDIVQEALVRALKGIDGIRDPGSQTSWLFKIALRSVFDYYTKRSSARAIENRMRTTGECRESDVFEVYARQQLVGRLLANLGEEERELVKLFYFDDMSTETIGEVYGMEGNAIRVKLHRIKEKLRDIASACEMSTYDSHAGC